ncbi:hypothetical protein WDW89_22055 [Deltaproteobacteria bacterium TL4]
MNGLLHKINILVIAGVLFLVSSQPLYAAKTLLGFMFGSKGKVEYSYQETQWKNAPRKKFINKTLFLKTSDNAEVKVWYYQNKRVYVLKAQSSMKVTPKEVRKLSGNVEQFLLDKPQFLGINQTYLSAKQFILKNKNKIQPSFDVIDLVLSNDYSEVIWPNIGEEYDYKVYVGTKTYEVPSDEKEFSRLTLIPLPGQSTKYRISAFEKSEMIYETQVHNIRWLSTSEEKAFHKSLQMLHQLDSDDILSALYLESLGLKVGAMDIYRQFLKKNPNENDIRSILIPLYAQLNLTHLHLEELETYFGSLNSK